MNDSKDIPKIKTITLNNKTYRNRDDSCVVVNDSVYHSPSKKPTDALTSWYFTNLLNWL